MLLNSYERLVKCFTQYNINGVYMKKLLATVTLITTLPLHASPQLLIDIIGKKHEALINQKMELWKNQADTALEEYKNQLKIPAQELQELAQRKKNKIRTRMRNFYDYVRFRTNNPSRVQLTYDYYQKCIDVQEAEFTHKDAFLNENIERYFSYYKQEAPDAIEKINAEFAYQDALLDENIKKHQHLYADLLQTTIKETVKIKLKDIIETDAPQATAQEIQEVMQTVGQETAQVLQAMQNIAPHVPAQTIKKEIEEATHAATQAITQSKKVEKITQALQERIIENIAELSDVSKNLKHFKLTTENIDTWIAKITTTKKLITAIDNLNLGFRTTLRRQIDLCNATRDSEEWQTSYSAIEALKNAIKHELKTAEKTQQIEGLVNDDWIQQLEDRLITYKALLIEKNDPQKNQEKLAQQLQFDAEKDAAHKEFKATASREAIMSQLVALAENQKALAHLFVFLKSQQEQNQ